MNAKVLKKDLKRKKSMNFILLVFVLLATMFLAAGLNNADVVVNGLHDFCKLEHVPDLYIVAMGGTKEQMSRDQESITEFIEKEREKGIITGERVDEYLLFGSNFYDEDGNKYDSENAVHIMTPSMEQILYDEKNQKITDIKNGTIYVSRKFLNEFNLEQGNTLVLRTDEYEMTFTIAGYVKDVIFGSRFMGDNRFLISDADYVKLLSKISDEEMLSANRYGRSYSVSTNQYDTLKADYDNSELNVSFSLKREEYTSLYIFDFIVVALLVMVSVLLVLICCIMLRFAIIFTINEDFKEIGIMKAIGIPDFSIRRLYVVKYVILSVAGAIAGTCLSIPLNNMLLKDTMENFVLKTNGNNTLSLMLVGILVVFMVMLTAFASTKRIKKMKPMDAIRNGNNGERFQKKGVLSMYKSHVVPSSFMALNDILSESRRFIVSAVVCMLGVWLVVMLTNSINTLGSEEVIKWFSMSDADLYFEDTEQILQHLRDDYDGYQTYLQEIRENLHEIDIRNVKTEILLRCRIRKGEQSKSSLAFLGVNTQTEDYYYLEGSAPRYKNEVAVTKRVADAVGAGIGDTVYINVTGTEQPYIITALYQSMNNFGEGIRFTKDVKYDSSLVSGSLGIQIDLSHESYGGKNEEQLAEIIRQIHKVYPEAKVKNTREYISVMVGGILDDMQGLKWLILTIVIIVNVMVVTLMQKMFLIRERGEMALLKSIGFTSGHIIAWQTKRVACVMLLGILIGIATSTVVAKYTAGYAFRYMGMEHVEFKICPMEVYVLYPAILFVSMIVVCMLVMQSVRKISPNEIRSEE